jgi:NADH:ubiquinone oxidoreductase subunit E
MAKRKVTVCAGTACYVLGGANLLLLAENLPKGLKNDVEIIGSPCLGLCQKNKEARPPFALIDDLEISEATIEKILHELTKE